MNIEEIKKEYTMKKKPVENPYKPHRKNIWFTAEQLKQLEEIREITGFDIATTVRASMDQFHRALTSK